MKFKLKAAVSFKVKGTSALNIIQLHLAWAADTSVSVKQKIHKVLVLLLSVIHFAKAFDFFSERWEGINLSSF